MQAAGDNGPQIWLVTGDGAASRERRRRRSIVGKAKRKGENKDREEERDKSVLSIRPDYICIRLLNPVSIGLDVCMHLGMQEGGLKAGQKGLIIRSERGT